MNKIFFLLIILGIFLIGFFIYSSQHNKKISNNIQNQTSENFNEEICKNYLENFVDVKNKKFVDKYVNHSLVLSDFRYTLWKINVTNTGNTTKKTIDNLPASGEHIFYTFYNDTFVKASESDNTIGIYSNNIDWELNKSTILQTAQETGVQIYRITDPEEFSNYDKILVLGGHKAYIDKYMPINIAKNFLNDEEKNNLEENDEVLIKDISNPFGINPEQELMIYAGSDRDFTKEIPMGDYDFRGVSGKLEGEGLPNIIEFMIGTRYDRFDTDGDNLNDYFEWKFSEKNGGLYDPLVPNDRYLLYLVANEKFKKVPSNFEDYIFNKQRFSKDNVIFLTKNDATFSNFKKEINKIAEKSDKNDFVFIYIAGHDQYGEKKTFMDGDIPYKTIDKIIDTINSKAIIIELCGCLDDEYMHILKEGSCPRIVSSGPIFNGMSSTKISKEKIDKNHDGYISIKEMIRYLKTTESDSGLIDLDNIASKVYLGSYNFINKSYWQKPQE